MKGRVCLVGAGPGDPELLTVRAVNRLGSANIVLHDALISREVLALVSPAALLINVGKRRGEKSITQDEINALMIGFASQGELIVRLKSGDPLIFGRAGEELDALRRAGIEVEIVPGITSAVAAAAAARISLTDRRSAEQVLLISAHHAADKTEPDWRRLISLRTTIVVYMPGPHNRIAEGLIQAGLPDDTPCLVTSKVSTPEEQSYRTTLGILCCLPALLSPSLLIVGDVAAPPEISNASVVSRPGCAIAEAAATNAVAVQNRCGQHRC